MEAPSTYTPYPSVSVAVPEKVPELVKLVIVPPPRRLIPRATSSPAVPEIVPELVKLVRVEVPNIIPYPKLLLAVPVIVPEFERVVIAVEL